MKNTLLAILLAISMAISAQAQTTTPVVDDLAMGVWNGTIAQQRYLVTDKTGALGFMMYGQDPTTSIVRLRPQMRMLGPSFVCGTTLLSTCDVNTSGMSMYAAQIQDSSATGRSLMTAADAAAARLAIGSGTSNFDGMYSSLASVPLTFATNSSLIGDASASGRAILTATDYAAQRGLLSVLTASEVAANYYPLTDNPSAFLTGITSGQVTGALGFTPYNATNPGGYITSSALSPYLTSATASSTYATSASMTTALASKADATALTAGLAAKQNTLSLTTTGSGAATLVGATLNVPTPATAAARSFSNPTRPLNTAFQPSSTRDAAVVYTVDISVTSVLLAGASGRVHLEYADDSGFTTNVVTVNSSPNATGGVLNVTNLGAGNVSGWIPAGKYARIRTQNVSQNPTFTFQGSQEVLQ